MWIDKLLSGYKNVQSFISVFVVECVSPPKRQCIRFHWLSLQWLVGLGISVWCRHSVQWLTWPMKTLDEGVFLCLRDAWWRQRLTCTWLAWTLAVLYSCMYCELSHSAFSHASLKWHSKGIHDLKLKRLCF